MWLIGMMGSGKTSVGRLAADRLVVPFYDTDEAIVALAGVEITRIWRDHGEAGFREMEKQVIQQVPPGVLAAAGGGAVLAPENRQTMRSRPPVIWLRALPETLSHRIGATTDRPLLNSVMARVDELQRILDARETDYQAAATHVLDTDGRDLDDIAGEVIELWSG